MAKMKRVKEPHKIQNVTKNRKPKQGHKLVWLTFIVIAIPCLLIGYVLLTSMGGQNKPVIGDRFDKKDLNPEITEKMLKEMKTELSHVENVEDVSINLKSATVRILLDLNDGINSEAAIQTVEEAYNKVDSICAIDTYFTNKKEAKMYDLEINVYNYLVDDAHTVDGQIFLELTKTGAGTKYIDSLNDSKNQDLVNQIRR